MYGEDPRIICRLFLGQVRWLWYPETGLRIAGEGLAMARAVNDPHAIAWSLVALADIHNFLRDPARAEQIAIEAIDVARQHRFPQWLALAQQARGWAMCQFGDTAHGVALIAEGIRRQHATGGMLVTTRGYCYLAAGYVRSGRPEAALRHVEAALTHAESFGEHFHRVHAEELQIQHAPAPEIECHSVRALDIARQQGARLWELRAATSLARLWQSEGRAADAHSLLAPLYDSLHRRF
jgi:predicted ATPase